MSKLQTELKLIDKPYLPGCTAAVPLRMACRLDLRSYTAEGHWCIALLFSIEHCQADTGRCGERALRPAHLPAENAVYRPPLPTFGARDASSCSRHNAHR